MNPGKPMHILLIKQTSLGDVLHCTPAIHALRSHFPNAKITLITDEIAEPILEGNPHLDRILTVNWYRYEIHPKKNWTLFSNAIKRALHVFKEVRKTKWDLVLDFQGLFKSMVYLYGVSSPLKATTKRWIGVRRMFANDIHAIDNYLALVRLFDIPTPYSFMEWYVSPSEKKRALEILTNAQLDPLSHRILCISPFTRWKTKDYPLDQYTDVIRYFINADPTRNRVLLSVLEQDKKRIESLLALPGVVPLIGSIRELAAVLEHVHVCLCGDSFPMHLACAMCTPLVALFGPTKTRRVGPVSPNYVEVLQAEGCMCLGCYQRQCDHHSCMKELSPWMVFESVQRVLEQVETITQT